MSLFKQFRHLTDPVTTFERLFRAALESLLPDLAACPWYVRESEVVNLFVFQHLIPQLQNEKLDISQLGVEVPIQRMKTDGKPEFGRRGDIVVWLHAKASRWRTCKPLALVEWKNISLPGQEPGGNRTRTSGRHCQFGTRCYAGFCGVRRHDRPA